jgi:PmbA protein
VPVLLAPGLAAGFIATFIVANLSGASVDAGRSAFSLEDFRRGRQVMRDDLTLAIDTTLDLEGAASPVSAEGVPGGRATLVQAGRLVRPVVDLKYAARCGFPATPVPGGSPGFLLRGAGRLRLSEQVRSQLAGGLQLHSVLGLHAQDPASGRYSLVAPHAEVIRGGRSIGRAKISLNGSFFDHVFDPRTELVVFPWRLNPGLLIWTSVEARA